MTKSCSVIGTSQDSPAISTSALVATSMPEVTFSPKVWAIGTTLFCTSPRAVPSEREAVRAYADAPSADGSLMTRRSEVSVSSQVAGAAPSRPLARPTGLVARAGASTRPV